MEFMVYNLSLKDFFPNDVLRESFASLSKYKHFFLNQGHAGLRPARAWFLKIDPVWIVSMRVYVCVFAPEAINN